MTGWKCEGDGALLIQFGGESGAVFGSRGNGETRLDIEITAGFDPLTGAVELVQKRFEKGVGIGFGQKSAAFGGDLADPLELLEVFTAIDDRRRRGC